MCLHTKDKYILEVIKKSLGVGQIYQHSPQLIQLRVESLKEFEAIIINFDQFQLKTQKQGDYEAIKLIYKKIKNKEHRVPPSLDRERGGGRDVHPTLSQ